MNKKTLPYEIQFEDIKAGQTIERRWSDGSREIAVNVHKDQGAWVSESRFVAFTDVGLETYWVVEDVIDLPTTPGAVVEDSKGLFWMLDDMQDWWCSKAALDEDDLDDFLRNEHIVRFDPSNLTRENRPDPDKEPRVDGDGDVWRWDGNSWWTFSSVSDRHYSWPTLREVSSFTLGDLRKINEC